MEKLKYRAISGLRWMEQYAKTDMVYLLQNSFWVNANTVITSIFSFLISISFAHYVSKDVYGIYQFLISLSSIIGALTLIGMNSAVTQAVARGYEGVLKTSVGAQVKFGFISFLAGFLIAGYYFLNGNATISLSLLIISLTLPLTNALNTWSAFLSGKKDFRNLFIFSQIINFSYYAGLLLVIFYWPKTIPIICAAFIINLISNFFVYRLILKRYMPNTQDEPEALDYGKKLSVSSILPMIALNLDNIIIFHFLGPTQLAIYAFASNIPERLGGLLRPISTVAFPKIAVKNPGEVAKVITQKTFQLFLVSLTGGIIYYLFSPILFRVFFPQYIDSILYSQVYAIAIIISTTASLPITSLFATRSKQIFTFNVVNPIFNIAIISLLAYLYGIWGAIFGRILGNLFYLTAGLYLSKK